MKWTYLLYGIVAGISPLVIGLMAAEVDPRSAAAQLPWFTIVTLPSGVVLGLIAAIFLR